MTVLSDWIGTMRRNFGPTSPAITTPVPNRSPADLLDQLRQVVFSLDPCGQWEYLSAAWCDLTGYGRDDCRGTDWLNYVHPQDRDRCSAHVRAQLPDPLNQPSVVLRLICKRGDYRWVELRANPLETDEGDGGRIVGTIVDVGRRVTREKQLQASHRTLGNLLDALPGMAYRCRNNRDWTMEYVSAGCLELTGYSPEELTNSKQLPFGALIDPDHQDRVWTEVQVALAEGRGFDLVYPIVSRGGGEIWAWERGKALYSTSGDLLGLEGFISDITRTKIDEERGLRNALFDIGSGLPRKSLFKEHVQHAIEEGKTRTDYRFALLILHLAQLEAALSKVRPEDGDRAVLELTRRLRTILEPADIIARLETASFGILLDKDSHTRNSSRVARRIQETLLAPIPVAGTEVFVRGSIGIAISGSRHQQSQEIIDDAMTALGRARELGGGRTEVFDPQEHARAAALIRMEQELQAAIDEDQFQVYWQPLVSARDERVVGLEARLGWHHPRRGVLFSDEFVPMAEDTQHIEPLWELMLAKVCRQMEAWQQLRLGKGLAVNVQIVGKSLLDADLILRLGEHLLDVLPPPFRLALGIPESVASQDPKTVHNMMQRLRQRKSARLVLDDFGTGTLALSVLRDLSVDLIRLNPSLIEGGQSDSRITAAVIAMAHALDIRVVADGIRTAVQLADMRRLGCDYVQGSFISPPIDAAAAEIMLGSTLMTRPGLADRNPTPTRESSGTALKPNRRKRP